MPRLRKYKENRLISIDENRATFTLILEMTIENIVEKDTVRRNEIDVMSYSKAVHKKVLRDTIENTLVSDLYKLLLQFKSNTFGNNGSRIKDSQLSHAHRGSRFFGR
jgi:hypothetical protein